MPTNPGPSRSEPIPLLSVWTLSGSFAGIWPDLAREHGLELETTAQPPAPSHNGTPRLVVVSLGGEEGSLDQALTRLRGDGIVPAVVTGLADHRLALRAVRGGAAEFFALPHDLQPLRQWLADRTAELRAAALAERFATREADKYRFEGILGDSPALRRALELASRVIPHGGVTVLITGETGTGKELLARAIHYNGPRRAGPFVDVNCAAIPDHLLESELFGHEKGAFTDASAAKPGLFEAAEGGAIFLDEIGHLSLPLQGKLLRVLEQRQIRRVGATVTRPVDVRVIAATHVDLAAAVRRGEFREDLYYRLNVVSLRLPSLRERASDVLLLAGAFLARFARDYELPVPVLTAEAERTLLSHPWSGNVRELRNTLERAILLGPRGRLDAGDLGLEAAPAAGPAGPLPFPASMREITRAAALAMVRQSEGNKSEAARRLRISRTRLLRLLALRERPAASSSEER